MMVKKHFNLALLTLLFLVLFLGLIEKKYVLAWIDNNVANVFLNQFLNQIFLHQVPIFLWLLGTLLIIYYTRVFFWKMYYPKKNGTLPPKIIRDIFGLVVWVVSIFLAVVYLFDQDLSVLFASSTIIVGVLGFSLRGMIADFFYGLATTIEQPYRLGDWIELNNTKSLIGKVVHITWRSTTIVSTENIHTILPHSVIAANNFNNYSYPDPLWRSSFKIILGNEITLYEVERLVFSAIKQVKETAKIDRTPVIKIAQFLPEGIEWLVCFWVLDYPMESSIRLQIQHNLLRNLNYCGITLPSKKLEVATHRHTLKSKTAGGWIKKLEFFADLNEFECEQLAKKAVRRLLVKDEVLFEQGDTGSSLFFVYQGLLDVFVKNNEGVNVRVDQFKAGSIFGEMSLLTDEPYTVTIIPHIDSVVYEIQKMMIEPYLREYPLFLEHIEMLLAERKLQSVNFFEHVNETDETMRESILMEVHQKIRKLFNLP